MKASKNLVLLIVLMATVSINGLDKRLSFQFPVSNEDRSRCLGDIHHCLEHIDVNSNHVPSGSSQEVIWRLACERTTRAASCMASGISDDCGETTRETIVSFLESWVSRMCSHKD